VFVKKYINISTRSILIGPLTLTLICFFLSFIFLDLKKVENDTYFDTYFFPHSTHPFFLKKIIVIIDGCSLFIFLQWSFCGKN
jgi:hypothetical protein